jgi:hypothetical protein
MTMVLSYTSASYRAPGVLARRIAFACALIPLLAGVLTFALWVATRATFLIFTGLWILPLGLVLFLVGCLCVGMYVTSCRRARVAVNRGSVVLAFALLICNFPIAIGLMVAASNLTRRVDIVVINGGTQPIDAVTIYTFGRSRSVQIGDVAPGSKQSHRLDVSDGPDVEVEVTQGGAALPPTKWGSLTGPDNPGTIRITVNNGTQTVTVRPFR